MTTRHPLPRLAVWSLALLCLVAVGSCRAAVAFSWNGSDCDGYWLMCVSNGKTNLIAATSQTNAMVNYWPNWSVAYVVATNHLGAISDPSNMITNTPPLPPTNLKRK